jgi:hypothetical protein
MYILPFIFSYLNVWRVVPHSKTSLHPRNVSLVIAHSKDPFLSVSEAEAHLTTLPCERLATCDTFDRPLPNTLRVEGHSKPFSPNVPQVIPYSKGPSSEFSGAKVHFYHTNSEIVQCNQGSILLRVLTQARGSQATNPLDKVYGNLGIVRRALGSAFDEEAIYPNYTISVLKLYICLAHYILATVPTFSLLKSC